MVLELLDIARVKHSGVAISLVKSDTSNVNGLGRAVTPQGHGMDDCWLSAHKGHEAHIIKWQPFVQNNHIPNPKIFNGDHHPISSHI